MKKTCATCGELRETRPYGKGGSNICFGCAFKTPEAKEETERQLGIRLAKAEAESPVVILGEDGPVPLKLPSEKAPS